MSTAKTYTVNVVDDPENPGELLLDLGNELCAEMGFQVGDTIEWIDQGDGSWLLLNQSTKKTVTPSATQ
jgi:hypothetical protein